MRMLIHDDALEEFRTLYAQENGEEITLAEAREIASRLVFLFEKLSGPPPNDTRDAI